MPSVYFKCPRCREVDYPTSSRTWPHSYRWDDEVQPIFEELTGQDIWFRKRTKECVNCQEEYQTVEMAHMYLGALIYEVQRLRSENEDLAYENAHLENAARSGASSGEVRFSYKQKPSSATYLGKITATPDGDVDVIPASDDDEVAFGGTPAEVTWYDDRVKIAFKKANPAAITQAYLSGAGRDAIIELRQLEDAVPDDDAEEDEDASAQNGRYAEEVDPTLNPSALRGFDLSSLELADDDEEE